MRDRRSKPATAPSPQRVESQTLACPHERPRTAGL
jgi:hypothetical protein